MLAILLANQNSLKVADSQILMASLKYDSL